MAFIITLLIFFFGVSLGSNIAQENLSMLEKELRGVRLEQESTELVMALTLEDSLLLCNTPLEKLTSTRGKMGKSLVKLEKDLGKLHPEVIEQKKQYAILQIREYLILKRMENACEKTIPTILYFYSNHGDCLNCEAQGYILDEIHLNEKKPVQIYSFDIHSNTTLVNALMRQYTVKTAPTLVLGGKTLSGFRQKEEIMPILT